MDIKFRAQSISTKQMVFGQIRFGTGIDKTFAWIYNEKSLNSINPETICQFTGLVDKKGNDLYKSDLFTDGKNNYRVYATKGGFAHSLPQFKSTYLGTSPYPLQSLSDEQTVYWFESNCEIIGNIWDNPELLV